MVTMHSSFDIRFLDESGSPLEDEYLLVRPSSPLCRGAAATRRHG